MSAPDIKANNNNNKKRKTTASPSAGQLPPKSAAASHSDPNIHGSTSLLASATTTSSSVVNNATKQQQLKNDRMALHAEVGYVPLTLDDIHKRIQELSRRVPVVPRFDLEEEEEDKKADQAAAPGDDETGQNGDKLLLSRSNASTTIPCPYNKTKIREWATAVQIVLEEFNLLVACVSPATYIWGTDRSGAAEQNLSLLSSELVRSQEQLLARVVPRLNDVLAPVVMLVTDKTVTTKQHSKKKTKKTTSTTNDTNGDQAAAAEGEDDDEVVEIKQNYFITTQEDPDYVNLCYCILARNAELLRQVVLANFDKLLQSVHDYLQAQHKDSQHDARGFVY